jgi:hypothetical protein
VLTLLVWQIPTRLTKNLAELFGDVREEVLFAFEALVPDKADGRQLGGTVFYQSALLTRLWRRRLGDAFGDEHGQDDRRSCQQPYLRRGSYVCVLILLIVENVLSWRRQRP